eukprot:Seg847.4 transcript_id=Seg847.4/GoldUCD/mRNA.D3Y31 product="Tumor protein p53-inducible nuclear protein 2" protein_id=Seg847.4/GoldUCD/D3Y31
MFSVLSAYLFGEEEEDNLATNEAISESEDVVEDWIFVDNAASNGQTTTLKQSADLRTMSMEESWFVTPPSCFSCHPKKVNRDPQVSNLENLLIEHPSMSVYGPRPAANDEQDEGPSPDQTADRPNTVANVEENAGNRHVGQGRVFLCQPQDNRVPFKDLGCNYDNSVAYTFTRKGAKRSNQTHQRSYTGRKNKKLSRRDGKHSGMVAQRAR